MKFDIRIFMKDDATMPALRFKGVPEEEKASFSGWLAGLPSGPVYKWYDENGEWHILRDAITHVLVTKNP